MIAAEPLPPLPDVEALITNAARRPGELHEPVPIDRQTAGWLAVEAERTKSHPDVLASVLVEAALVAEDLGASCLRGAPPDTQQTSRLAVSAAEADYLRALTVGRSGPRRAVRQRPTVALPMRLIGRLSGRLLADLLRVVPADDALAWEVAALRQGRTLAECVLVDVSRSRG